MIRLATAQDVPQIANGLYELVATTGWHLFDKHPSRRTLEGFLYDKLLSSKNVLLVWEDGSGQITGFCGGALGQFYAPPHMPTVYEWGWYGPPKQCAALWREVRTWGKQHGAELAGYATIEKTDSKPGRIHEHIIWKRLT